MLARSALWSPDKSCYSQTVLLVQRLRFFKTTCPSVLPDDFGTRIITKDMAAKLSAFATSCCRIMLNIKCLHKVSNHRVYDLNGISQLSYCHTCQLSRFSRESPSFSSNLPVSRLEHQISRIKWTFEHFCALV